MTLSKKIFIADAQTLERFLLGGLFVLALAVRIRQEI
jgi:hypothetical protein